MAPKLCQRNNQRKFLLTMVAQVHAGNNLRKQQSKGLPRDEIHLINSRIPFESHFFTILTWNAFSMALSCCRPNPNITFVLQEAAVYPQDSRVDARMSRDFGRDETKTTISGLVSPSKHDLGSIEYSDDRRTAEGVTFLVEAVAVGFLIGCSVDTAVFGKYCGIHPVCRTQAMTKHEAKRAAAAWVLLLDRCIKASVRRWSFEKTQHGWRTFWTIWRGPQDGLL